MNEKSQIAQEKLYSEERKRRRASGITKEVAGWQKIWRTPDNREKQPTVPSPTPSPQEGEWKLKMHSQKKTHNPGNRLDILAARGAHISRKP
jgi:hypothetical protein